MSNKPKQTCAYLYADGHAVLCYEQDVRVGKITQTVEWVVIHEKYTEAYLNFKGRIAFSRYGAVALLKLAKQAKRIHASEKSIESGSEASRNLGVAIGNLSFDFADGSYLYFHDTSILSGPYTYQPDVVELFDATTTQWGFNGKVAEIKLANGPTVTNATPAAA